MWGDETGRFAVGEIVGARRRSRVGESVGVPMRMRSGGGGSG